MNARPSRRAKRLLAPACLAVLLASAGTASAATITFTFAGTAASGSVAGTTFGPTDFVVTATGDTEDRQGERGIYWIVHRSASIDLAGIGSFRFLQPTQTFVNNPSSLVGFGLTTLDLVYGPTDRAFASYGLRSPIGPVSGTGELLQWDFDPIRTSGGVMQLATGEIPASFQAVAPIPLPAGAPLLLSALAALAVFLRRKGATA